MPTVEANAKQASDGAEALFTANRRIKPAEASLQVRPARSVRSRKRTCSQKPAKPVIAQAGLNDWQASSQRAKPSLFAYRLVA